MNRKTIQNTIGNPLEGIFSRALFIMVIAMAAYHLLFTQFPWQGPTAHRIIHLGFAFAVTLIHLARKSPHKIDRFVKLVLFFLSVGVAVYLLIELDEIMDFRQTMPLPSDLVAGGIVVFLSFIGSYFLFGKTFPIIAIFFLAYIIIARYFPPPFTVAGISSKRLLMWISQLGTPEGVYGDILGISARYLFLVILFGALLNTFGGQRFIMKVGRWVGSKMKAGPAATALVASSLLGSVTGSTIANITLTGSFTIPMMKKAGYEPAQAGAIEAASSNGGQFLPPVMGACAFIMAGYTGIPYIHIALVCVLPALIYYFCVFLYVQMNAYKKDIATIVEPMDIKKLLLDAPNFIVPLVTLVVLLAKGFTLPFVIFWSTIVLMIISVLGWIRKEVRPNLREIKEGLVGSVLIASEMAVVCALIGVIATCISVSGLAMKLPMMIGDLSHGIIFVALFIAMVSSILLGMGVPTIAAYMLVVIGAVPALVAMKVPMLHAHLFCFLFATLSHLTPPVALGALVASRIAGGKFWATSWESIKAASVAYLLPYFIIFAPVIVLRHEGTLGLLCLEIAGILLAVYSMQTGLVGYCFGLLGPYKRLGFLISSLLLLAFVFSKTYILFVAGATLLAISLARQGKGKRKIKLSHHSTL